MGKTTRQGERTDDDVPGLVPCRSEAASPTPTVGSYALTSALPRNDDENEAPRRVEAVTGGSDGTCGDTGMTAVGYGKEDSSRSHSYRDNAKNGTERSSLSRKCRGTLSQGQDKPDKHTTPRKTRPVILAEDVEEIQTEKSSATKASHASQSPDRRRHTLRGSAWEIAVHSPRKRCRSSKRSSAPKRFTIMKDLRASLAAEAASGREFGSANGISRPAHRGHRTTAEGVLREASLSTSKKAKSDTVDFNSTGGNTEASQIYLNSRNVRWYYNNCRMVWGQKTEDETADFAARKFHIRESRNPDLGERLTQIYNRIGPSDGKAWTYQSNPAVVVTGCTCLISLWTLWFAPFIASFWNAYQPLCEVLTRADLALDIIYAICTLLTLRISYVDMDSRVEVIDPTVIRAMIFSSPFFYYELLSSCFVIPVLVAGSTLRYLLLLKLLRAVNLWKLPRWTDRLRVKPMFRVLRLLAALFTAQHGVACVLNYVIEKEELWVDYTEQAKGKLRSLHAGEADKYTLCYNYAINMLQAQISKGELLSRVEGGIKEEKSHLFHYLNSDVALSTNYCVVAPLGTIMVATLYGEINVLYQRLNILSDRHVESMAYITEAMRTLKLPSEMQGRVRQYFRFLHANRDKTALSTLLDSLSEPLLQELKLNLYGDLIRKANFFKHCNPDFIRMILTKLHDCVYCPGDNIIQTGQEGDCMYFILKGSVDVLVDGSTVLASKREGDYFGELALLKPGTSRTATLRARTYTIVARLYARDFDEALEKYPHEMMNAFAGMNLLDPQQHPKSEYGMQELATTLEEAKARIARAKEKKNT